MEIFLLKFDLTLYPKDCSLKRGAIVIFTFYDCIFYLLLNYFYYIPVDLSIATNNSFSFTQCKFIPLQLFCKKFEDLKRIYRNLLVFWFSNGDREW